MKDPLVVLYKSQGYSNLPSNGGGMQIEEKKNNFLPISL